MKKLKEFSFPILIILVIIISGVVSFCFYQNKVSVLADETAKLEKQYNNLVKANKKPYEKNLTKIKDQAEGVIKKGKRLAELEMKLRDYRLDFLKKNKNATDVPVPDDNEILMSLAKLRANRSLDEARDFWITEKIDTIEFADSFDYSSESTPVCFILKRNGREYGFVTGYYDGKTEGFSGFHKHLFKVNEKQ